MSNHLSSLKVALKIKRIATCGRTALMQISLQPTGFTSSVRHRTLLWALTPLLSPLPYLHKAVSFLWHFP